ncbi:hypothetical protein A134_00480 [Vibrio crassostreae 9CS106]|nr:hypothetical protein A134_00480 [Vibrio crassostreae 9CS106]
MNKLYFVHLYDDFSGSPKVLSQMIMAIKEEAECIPVIGSASSGFISSLGEEVVRFFYRRGRNKLETLGYYVLSQLALFFKLFILLRDDKKKDVKSTIIVNTLLPFSAAFVAKLFGVKVVYYCHEVSIRPALLHKFLLFVKNTLSSQNVYVSEFVRNKVQREGESSTVIYNSLEPIFYNSELGYKDLHNKWKRKLVIMACSLKGYKGIREFVQIAEHCPECKFILVVNDSEINVGNYLSKYSTPDNLEWVCQPECIIDYYREAFLTVNLSKPEGWIETFGLTLIEGMSQNTPVIAPEIGGPCEFVNENNGFLIDSREVGLISERILQLSSNYEYWLGLSKGAKSSCNDFSPQLYKDQIMKVLL